MDALRLPGAAPGTAPVPAGAAGTRIWDAAHARWRVQVYGATGARGRELVLALLEAGHPPARLELYARGPHTLSWRGTPLQVRPVPLKPTRAEVAFLCLPPEAGRAVARLLGGRRLVDLGGALRGQSAGLLAPGVNDGALGAFTEEVALPLPSAVLLAPALARLERAVGLAELDLFVSVAAAQGGAREIAALRAELAGGRPAPAGGAEPRVGNLRPVDALAPGFEADLAGELRHLLARPDLPIDVAAVAGDCERSDCFAVRALLHAPLEADAARELLRGDDALAVVPDPGPSAAAAAGGTRLLVGRIRPGSRGARSLCFSAAGDQLRAGSVQAALRLAARLAA